MSYVCNKKIAIYIYSYVITLYVATFYLLSQIQNALALHEKLRDQCIIADESLVRL